MRQPQHDERWLVFLLISALFTAVMAGFGIASLLRARRIRSGT
jgi:hypothetical protein